MNEISWLFLHCFNIPNSLPTSTLQISELGSMKELMHSEMDGDEISNLPMPLKQLNEPYPRTQNRFAVSIT